MTKQGKTNAILAAFAEGYRAIVKLEGKDVEIFGVVFDGSDIFGFARSTSTANSTSAAETFEKLKITDAETSRYFCESICGATSDAESAL